MSAAAIIESAIAAIESAFSHVQLGSGVSLLQAQAIDNYESEEVQLAERQRDELEDWKRIPDAWIMDGPCAMTFMDPAGILFHLPASMRFALRNYYRVSNTSIDSAMIRLTDDAFIARFKPQLSREQIDAITLFLDAYEHLEPDLSRLLSHARIQWLTPQLE